MNVGHGVGKMRELVGGGSARSIVAFRATDGPVNDQRTADYILPRNESPVAAIKALIAVIAENEVLPGRHHQLTVLNVLFQFLEPAAFLPLHDVIPLGKLVAINVVAGGAVADVRLSQGETIYP